MEPDTPQTAVAGSEAELRSAARAELDALLRDAVITPRGLVTQGAGMRGARISLVICGVLTAVGLALGSAGTPGLRSGAASAAGSAGTEFPATSPDHGPRTVAGGSGLVQLRDEAFEAIEDGDPARARRAAARFLLRQREATPSLRAERPEVWRVLGDALRHEALVFEAPDGGRR